jgi:hypothetical protein
MSGNWYDTAQICINGHVITDSIVTSPEVSQKFCNKCGAPTITNCQTCNASIRGFHHLDGIIYSSDYKLPNFCPECGKPYPWTDAKLKAAKELSDELENLSPEERETLKKSLDDIVRDTPQTPVAATRFKKIAAKAGKVAADGLRDILVDIASEAAKKVIWPSQNKGSPRGAKPLFYKSPLPLWERIKVRGRKSRIFTLTLPSPIKGEGLRGGVGLRLLRPSMQGLAMTYNIRGKLK